MKAFISVLLFVLSGVTGLYAQESDADTIINKIFSILKAKDENAFIALHPSKEESIKLALQSLEKQRNILTDFAKTDSALNGGKFSTPDFDTFLKEAKKDLLKSSAFEEMEKRMRKCFATFIKEGEEKGVTWDKTHLINSEIDTLSADSIKKYFGSDEFKMINGIIHFACGDESFKLNFDKVVRLGEYGWCSIYLKHVVNESEGFPADGSVVTEVILENIEEEEPPPPPPPPPPTKPENKKSVSKNKVKAHK
jgi:hypothetical protein